MDDTSYPTIKGFTFASQLGKGGNGKVFCVWTDEDDPQEQALKVLDTEMMHPELRERFAREVRILSSLSHPSVIPILKHDLDAHEPWFTMPIAAHDLGVSVEQHTLSDDDKRRIFSQVLSGVQYAHSKGVIHRDINPSNVLMMKNGRICVSDFGLSRNLQTHSANLTAVMTGRGTAGYVAPEQWQDAHNVDFRTDIYALGGLLYFMTTGVQPLFYEITLVPVMYRKIVDRCRQNNPDDRYSSVALLREDFEVIWTHFDNESIKPSDFIVAINHLAQYSTETTKLVVERYRTGCEDWSLVRATLSAWSQDAIEAAYEADKETTTKIASIVLEHIPRDVDFHFLDVVSLFARNVFEVASNHEDRDLQLMTLRALIREGSRFHRWNLGRQFAFLSGLPRAKEDQAIFEQAIELEISSAPFVLEYVYNEELKAFIEARIPSPPDPTLYIGFEEESPF
ncbi:MAG: serine/threonine-protein kinase [Thermomicrobiales bacterium]